MLSEINGATASQIKLHLPVASSVVSEKGQVVISNPVSSAAPSNEAPKPKVQLPKPVDIKLDMEKMRANLQESLEKINAVLRDGGRNLNFSIDNSTGGIIVLVKNTDTGEVVRQIPNDAIVRVAHSIEALKGLLHNKLI